MTTNASHPYPIISKVTRDPYIDFVHEFELQIDAMAQFALIDCDPDTRARIDARVDDLDDFIGRLCD